MTRALLPVFSAAALLFAVPNTTPTADAAPSFPIDIDILYCWGNSWPDQPCTTGSVGGFTLQADGTFTDPGGGSGTWTYVPSRNFAFQATYTGYGTIYAGKHLGRGELEGLMASGGVPAGTWSGSVVR